MKPNITNSNINSDRNVPQPSSAPSQHVRGLIEGNTPPSSHCRLYVLAYNRLLRETLAKLLAKRNDLTVVGQSAATTDAVRDLIDSHADLLLINSGGDVRNDLSIVRMVRSQAPAVRVMMLGMNDEPQEFLHCIRAGIAGYVLRDASSQSVLEAVQVVSRGGAFCDGHLCQLLFNYFEKNSSALPSFVLRDTLGLTRREQELVPLLARGASNKEIADQFCLSEQTVKNHLYRMKQKVGAANRLGIVHLCRSHGLNV